MQSSAYRPSEFKGSHTDAEKSAQNKKACSYFAFQFNISENWQHVASLSPRFVTPTWLLAALADVFRCSKGCNLAEKLGISIPDPSGICTLKRVSCSSSPPSPAPILLRLPSSLLTLLWFPRPGALLTLAAAPLCFCFPEISVAPESLAAVSHTGIAPRGGDSFVAELCKIALLGWRFLGEANWNGGQHFCT